MSKITKEIATQVAKKLTEKKFKELLKIETDLNKEVYDFALSKVPEDVLLCFKKHKNLFSTSGSISLVGNGFNHEWMPLNERLPLKDSNFTPDKETAKRILLLFNLKATKNKELKELIFEIETALYNLRTYKKVQEVFPDAFAHLPSQTSTTLVVNVSAIKKKLNS